MGKGRGDVWKGVKTRKGRRLGRCNSHMYRGRKRKNYERGEGGGKEEMIYGGG